ncbi:MAG: GAF domain-containing sensor histidine kinase [Acidimicrobiales bacterium]
MTNLLDQPPAARRDTRSRRGMQPVAGRRQSDGAVFAAFAAADRLVSFNPVILAIRWATTVACFALSASAFLEADLTIVPWAAAILANTVIRSVQPLEFTDDTRSLLNLIFEIALTVLAVTLTGFWHSPLIFSLVNTIILAGFARGFGFALRISVASTVAVSLPSLSHAQWTGDEWRISAQWSLVLLLVGVVAGYGRRISGEATRQQSIALDRLSHLTDANALLYNLHRVAQTLPASLDLEEVLESTLVRLRGLVPVDSAVIFTIEETDGTWIMKRRQAATGSLVRELSELPPGAQQAVRTLRPAVTALSGDGTGSFGATTRSALTTPLIARGNLIGLISVESVDEDAYSLRDREVLLGFAEPVALAVDNARWFARLRTVGADEERTRIARDLHDRIGQALAYLAFEIDRLIRKESLGEELAQPLADLRGDLKNVIGEVRDTLYDLRTDVGREKDFTSTVEEFGARVAERSGLALELDCDQNDRLPILQEREMWRIAQEAIINIERHAEASLARVTWRSNGANAVLEVVDDGRGFPAGSAGRPDSYGILGMRERASSIGASLEIISSPGEGTTVRCYLAQE